MNDSTLRRLAQVLTALVTAILLFSAAMLYLSPDHTDLIWLWNQMRTIVTLGAPIIGLVIVSRQPRNRIGWLLIIYGGIVGLRSLGHAIYFTHGSQPVGYSSIETFLLWFTEPANLFILAFPILLMLWFPDEQLPSRRWRALLVWLFASIAILFLLTFVSGPNWNGGEEAAGIVIDNPYGWLPENIPLLTAFPPFLSVVLITILAAFSLIFRYRAAQPLVRLQLRWFVLGGFAFIVLDFLSTFLVRPGTEGGFQLLATILSSVSILPLYSAIGIAILRYRLYDIDIIIRKTVQYGVVTALLALVYFGLVVLLQTLFGRATGEQSPVIIVISTLAIAALFTPLRRRVQALIDRRFFRQKYDAQQILTQFAQTARDEMELDELTALLVEVVQETMQPEQASLWLKSVDQ